MRISGIVDEAQFGHLSVGGEHLLRGLHKGARLGVAISRPANRLAVDPQRHVVEERAAVDLGQVDLALHGIGERLERAQHVLSVHPDVEGEVVARSRRNTDER